MAKQTGKLVRGHEGRRLRAPALAFALMSAACLAVRPARADRIALSRFEPAERGSRFFVADSLELPPSLRVAAGVVASAAERLQTDKQSRLVERQFVLHPGASVVVAPGVRFGVDLPVVAAQSGETTVLAGRFEAPPRRGPVLGDLRASFDVALLQPGRGTGEEVRARDLDGLRVAAGVSAYLPTGSQDDFASDGTARFAVRLASAFRSGPFVAAARVGYMYRRELPALGSVSLGAEGTFAAAVGVRAGALTVGPEVYGSTILRDAFAPRSTPFEGLVGAHYDLGDVRVGAGLGTYLVGGLGASPARLVASVEYAPGPAPPRDRDRDGVLDTEDACPDVPQGPGPALTPGCPGAPRDADRDGIIDLEDACPDLPGIRSTDPTIDGCPDKDRDGVPDPIDACPDVAGARAAVPRFHGCPPDKDGDDVPDAEDACPDAPGVRTPDPATNGCAPPPADRDGDGVPDARDRCPEEQGFDGPAVLEEARGCPMVQRVGDAVRLALPLVTTEAGKIAPESELAVRALAEWLVAHPDVKLRVEAHTDDARGGPRGPIRVTRARATAVVDALVRAGVARGRLEPRGLGTTMPELGTTIVLRVVRPAEPKPR